MAANLNRFSTVGHLLIPERRRRVRIVTLKNFGILLLSCLVIFAAAEIVARARRPAVDGYGRIIDRQLPQHPAVATRAPEVVTEGEIPDQTAADPWLVEPAARSQYLGTPQAGAPALPVPSSTVPPAQPVRPADGSGKVAIVGNGSDVKIVATSSATTPQLSGGIFKPEAPHQ